MSDPLYVLDLLRDLDIDFRMAGNGLVTGVTNDSRMVAPGYLFVAIRGNYVDGHTFISEAVSKGAGYLVVEDSSVVPKNYKGKVIQVVSTRSAFDLICSNRFGAPGRDLFCVGVTGTDGKTTVTRMIEVVLGHAGIPTAVIGNIDHHFGNHKWTAVGTTPAPNIVQERLAQFKELGAKAVTMEVTSHALSQSRVTSVPFDVAIFTNLTRDHLDYHGTTENYFAAKERFFTEVLPASPKSPRYALINLDTPFGSRIRVPKGVIRWTYGAAGSGADLEYRVESAELSRTLITLKIRGASVSLRLPLPMAFNAANACAAIGTGLAAGICVDKSVAALERFAGVPGRMQRVMYGGERLVFVDYAHTPDAIEKVLSYLRAALAKGPRLGRLISLFGCGGDRDRGKRPLMREMASKYSDLVVITSDNPRSESPLAIIDDIIAGAPSSKKMVVEPDRANAIRKAIQLADVNDVVVLLGKGHEEFQVFATHTDSFSDRAVALGALNGL